VAKPELGSKRQCLSCGTKFFDMNKDPILCPKCGTVFQAAPPTRAAQRAAAAAAKDDDEVETESGAEMVSLEDADAEAGPDKAADVGDDIEIDDDDATDDTFLEEEEEDNDDVSDLIDGDIEDDEEG
jgi:uncharacterized protein (TIGR02300 family)